LLASEFALHEYLDAMDDGAVFVVYLLDVDVDAESTNDAQESFH
jgi:hypothetical protein